MVLFILAIVGMSFAVGVDDCMVINSPGVYTLTDHVFGADYYSDYGYICFRINSSDVTLDCAGYDITGFNDMYGVLANSGTGSLDNVTVKNCNISNYAFPLYAWGTFPNQIENCVIRNNTLGGNGVSIMLQLADNCTIEDNLILYDASLYSLNSSRIRNNTIASDNCYGLSVGSAWFNDAPAYNYYDVISGNTVQGCFDDGFSLESLMNSTVENNLAAENYYSGFYFSNAYDNTVRNNTARNNSLDDLYTAGFEIGGEGNLFENNTAENNSNGFDVFYSQNILRNNHAYHNFLGLTLESKATGNIVENNTFEENVYVDMIVAGDARALQFNRAGCENTIRNNTGSGGRPIYYSNQGGTDLNGGTYSEVILCGADQSNLTGVTVAGSDGLSNNGFMVLYSPDSTLDGLVSDDNAVGVWLYGCDNCTVRRGHASGNAVGYLVSYSSLVKVSDLSSFSNNASLTNLFGGTGLGFLAQLLSGGGIIEITQMPSFMQESEILASASAQRRSIYSNNTYTNLEIYDNTYGMTLASTGNVTLNRVDIHDNSNWGIADMGGSNEFPVAVISSDSELYRNGRNFLSFLMDIGTTNSLESEMEILRSEEQSIPLLPEGILWGEYFQASLLYNSMLGGGYDTPAQWSMDEVRHGIRSPSVLLSADDAAESVYLTSETDLPARRSFSYTRGQQTITLNLNLTGPSNNKTSVRNEYFSIIGMVPTCAGQASLVKGVEIPCLPTIENFAVSPGGSMVGYGMDTIELYYLNITDVYQPEQYAATIMAPTQNKTYNVEGEWLPVPDQGLEDGSIHVRLLEIQESQLLGGFLGSGSESEFYQGVYGLFATSVPTEGGDNGEPRPEEPEQNQTQPECTSDSGCAVNEQCDGGICARIICECGEVKSHECVEYECCSDSNCGSGETCQNHACKGEEPKFECTSDQQCAATSFCQMPSGAAGGTCEQVEALPCGEVKNHKFVAYGYECGSEPGCQPCQPGYACANHQCIQNDVSCPSTGIVGDRKTCEAKRDGVACPNCDYVVTAPNGQKFGGKTDESGNFELPLDMKGTYQVALLKDGQPVRVIQVQAFPQAQPEQPEKPTATGPDMSFLLWVLVLFVLLVGGILYWRSMGSKGKQKK
jgi:parallel beta-helix repeat protein